MMITVCFVQTNCPTATKHKLSKVKYEDEVKSSRSNGSGLCALLLVTALLPILTKINPWYAGIQNEYH